MQKKLRTDNRGTSIIELLIYIAISSFILIDITGILSSVVFMQTKVDTIAREDENARVLMRLMSESIEESASVTSPSTANTSATSLILKNNSGNTITYSITSGIVYEQVNAATAQAISSNDIYVSSLTFTVESEAGLTPSINIKLNIQGSATNSATATHYETTDAQRNI